MERLACLNEVLWCHSVVLAQQETLAPTADQKRDQNKEEGRLPACGHYAQAMDRQAVSDLFGTVSFVVWLFAQSPQLYENYRNKSCQGLSIVFLVQWMVGDVTNLIGCLLTHQLAFQIAIATYFCSIDVCILLQYYHYWKRDRRIAQKKLRVARHYYKRSQTLNSLPTSKSVPQGWPGAERRTQEPEQLVGLFEQQQKPGRSISVQARINDAAAAAAGQRQLVSDAHSRTRTTSLMARRPQSQKRAMTSLDMDSSYRALGEAAKSVAQLALESERRLAEREARQRWAWKMASTYAEKPRRQDPSSSKQNGYSDEEENAPVPEHMVASTSSIASGNTDHRSYPAFGTMSTPNIGSADRSITSSPVEGTFPPQSPDIRRGRGMQRTATVFEEAEAAAKQMQAADPSEASSAVRPMTTRFAGATSRPSVSRSSTRASIASLSRKQTGMVLLGMTALFAWSGGNGGDSGAVGMRDMRADAKIGKGRVIGPSPSLWAPSSRDYVSSANSPLTFVANAYPPMHWWSPADQTHKTFADGPPPPPHHKVSWERIIGRVSAWSCTVMYMTSRIPQIWTNLQRRSVQGLSILLFIAAAAGNLFYTLSILLNPRAHGAPRERYLYLMDSLPFLLGSGGTLIFDAVIVCQWIAWRGQEPAVAPDHKPPAEILATTAALTPSVSSPSFMLRKKSYGSTNAIRPHKATVQSRWQSLERQPLL